MPQGTFIYKAEDLIERVYFPHTGVISLIVGLTSGQFVEAGMLGRNGVIGAGVPLDGAASPRFPARSRRRPQRSLARFLFHALTLQPA